MTVCDASDVINVVPVTLYVTFARFVLDNSAEELTSAVMFIITVLLFSIVSMLQFICLPSQLQPIFSPVFAGILCVELLVQLNPSGNVSLNTTSVIFAPALLFVIFIVNVTLCPGSAVAFPVFVNETFICGMTLIVALSFGSGVGVYDELSTG